MDKERMRQIVEDAMVKTEHLDANHFKRISTLSPKAQNNIKSGFGHYCPEDEMLGFVDTTMFGNGKKGFLLGINGIYSEQFSRIKEVDRVIFEEIVSVEEKDGDNLVVTTKTGKTYPVYTLNHTRYFLAFLQAVLEDMNVGTAAPVAEPVLTQVVDDAEVQAQLDEIMKIFDSGDQKRAFELWLSLAEAGNATAQNCIAISYKRGEGVEVDLEKHVYWLRKSAEAGNAKAYSNLGVAYRKGEGVEKNMEESARWSKAAAELGHVPAMNRIGDAYYYGEGVPQNYAEAVKWYRKAADAGNDDAMTNLGTAYYRGEGTEIDFDEAAKWFEAGAEKGQGASMYFLAICHGNGQGKVQNYETSLQWAEKALEAGYQPAEALVKTIKSILKDQKPKEAQVPDWLPQDKTIDRDTIYLYKEDDVHYFKDKETGNTLEIFSPFYSNSLSNLKPGKDYFVHYRNGEFSGCSRNREAICSQKVPFGAYYQSNDKEKEPIIWKVVDIRDDRALLVSDKILEVHKFKSINAVYDNFLMENLRLGRKIDPSLLELHRINKDDYHEMLKKRDKGINWETSDLRIWLNETFFEAAFNPDEQAEIFEATIPKVLNPTYQDRQTEETLDKVFILSMDEIVSYFCDKDDELEVRAYRKTVDEGYSIEGDFMAEVTPYVEHKKELVTGRPIYWTRTPAGHPLYIIYEHANIPPNFCGHVCCLPLGVRPAIWVKKDVLDK